MQRNVYQKAMSKPARSLKIGRFSVLGFLGFASAFAAIATLIDTTSAPSNQITNTNSNDSLNGDTELSPEDSFRGKSGVGSDPDSRPPTGGKQNPDHFNRRQRLKTPWVLERVVATTEAQRQFTERQLAVAQRQAPRQQRAEAAKAQQDAAAQRQRELDRFTNSRRMAHNQFLPGDETPRGRQAGRDIRGMDGSRQRSMSTASSYSASSDDSF